MIASLLLGAAVLWPPPPSLAAGTQSAQLTELRRAGKTSDALDSASRLLSLAAEQDGRESLAVARALVLVA